MHNRSALERPLTQEARTVHAPLTTLTRLGADLTAGAGSAAMVERLVDDLARPYAVDFSVRYEAAPAERALTLHDTTGIAARHLPALEVVHLGEAVCGMVAQQRRPEAHGRVDADPDPRLALARELDATAYASFPLTAGATLLGTLSVGSRTRPRFEPEELTVLGLAADLVAAAAAREQDTAALDAAVTARAVAEERQRHLEAALVSNRTIAMAIGIVMARKALTDDAAQRWLAEASQRRNTKMRTLAEQIVFTGSLDL
ncbi:GAF and ANTAR domain-containing protein [Modestobacter italicus]|uniref:GAF and ANTAR domain-containing protein n=1 Tax=Modestobacter italicus (strain DSM 44449 / CECT 9708 / BC 501) TaxID=2732864 RepID=UPI0014127091|nr:GAF and ANTAR domain-containing protein [Modestobacter marinus]